jgi:hypothetical protein
MVDSCAVADRVLDAFDMRQAGQIVLVKARIHKL